MKNPEKFQDTIDASTWNNVHILLEDSQPIALLEFTETNISDESKERHEVLKRLLDNIDSEDFQFLVKALNTSFDKNMIPQIKSFLSEKPIYTSLGICLRSDLQSKKSGYSEKLYEVISNGIVYGWTSNPIIVRQRRKLFKNTLYFPAYGEFPKNAEEWAICLYVYADVLSKNDHKIEGLEFGTVYSKYFVEERGEDYINIAKSMEKSKKISNLDRRRIEFILGKKNCAGAIVSWN